MKKVWIGIMVIIAFGAGYFAKPVKTITVTRWQRIYSLPEGVTIQEICNNFMGEQARKQMEDWKAAYQQGYLER